MSKLYYWLLVIVLGTLYCLSIQPSDLALSQTIDKPGILLQVNRLRISNGIAPLALNPSLEKAAQSHSDDMAAKGFVDHTGSDGSSPVDRITAAKYPAWPSTRVWAETVYAGSQGFVQALNFFEKDDVQRRNLLNPRYREIGIGAATATNAAGTQTVYWTLTFGAQPNVLPIFVNDGATLINVPQVAIHLTQEEAVPGGEGASMGSAIEVRVSSDSSFANGAWQQWESLIPYTFSSVPGLKTVYVQLRDGGGRTTISTASIQYDPNSTPQVMPLGPGAQITTTESLDRVPEASSTPFPSVAPVQTVQPVQPQFTAEPDSAIRPSVTPIVLVVTAQSTAVFNATETASPTSQAPPLLERTNSALPDWLLPAYFVAQGAVVVVFIVAFFRMKSSEHKSVSDSTHGKV